jgi:hypothetical protein
MLFPFQPLLFLFIFILSGFIQKCKFNFQQKRPRPFLHQAGAFPLLDLNAISSYLYDGPLRIFTPLKNFRLPIGSS